MTRFLRLIKGGFIAPSAAAAVLLVGLADAPVRGDDPVSSNVRYTGEIVRIFDRKCAPCHSTNSIAMPLANYGQVREWGRAIREEIVEQRMPPPSAARGYGRFRNERALTARETATILSWLDGGMARGDDRDLPAAAAAQAESLRPPDVHLAIPPQPVPANSDHVVRRVIVETNLARPRRVSRLIVNPGRRRVLRGALVFVERESRMQWIGAWAPWQGSVEPPARHGFALPAGARLAVELHYRGNTEAVEDTSGVDLYFADAEPSGRGREQTALAELLVDSAAPARLPASAAIWAIVPSAETGVTSLEMTARRPNGAVDLLLWIPRYQHDWPEALALDEVVTLPAGTVVSLNVQPPTAAASARLSLVPR